MPITDIRLHTFRNLDCELRDLKRITILCGKNSSGKSTILSSIASEKHRVIGKRLVDFDWPYALATNTSLIPANVSEEEFNSLLLSTSSARDVWFATDGEAFVAEARRIDDDAYQQKIKNIVPAFNSAFADKPVIALLPEIRRVEAGVGPSHVANVNASGAGLVAHLFALKNSPPDTEAFHLYRVLADHFLRISGGIELDTHWPGGVNNVSLFFRQTGKEWVASSECGLGLQQLVLLLYFAIAAPAEVVLVEEPEVHMHPDMQRKVLYLMREYSTKQFIMTTHSNVFLDETLIDRVYQTSYDGTIHVDEATSKAQMLGELGYSIVDNLLADIVVLTEGPSDIPIIEEFLMKMGLYERFNIKFWPLGGDIMSRVDLSVFTQSYRVVALIDQDPKSAKARNRFKSECERHSIFVHQLSKRAIENYFTLDALRSVFSVQIPEHVTEIPADVDVEELLAMTIKKRSRNIARAMTLDDIAGTDLATFLDTIGELLATTQLVHTSELAR